MTTVFVSDKTKQNSTLSANESDEFVIILFSMGAVGSVCDSPQSTADCISIMENIFCLKVGYSFNHTYITFVFTRRETNLALFSKSIAFHICNTHYHAISG